MNAWYKYKVGYFEEDSSGIIYRTGIVYAKSLAEAMEKVAESYEEDCIDSCEITYLEDLMCLELEELLQGWEKDEIREAVKSLE